MTKKIRAVLLVAIFALAPGLARAADVADPAKFIDSLVDNALQTLRNPGLPDGEREARLGSMLTQNFDIPRIARYVLGRYWLSASDDERKAFVHLFERWIVRTYAARLGQYTTTATVKVTGARPESDTGAVVMSQIIRPSGPPTKIEWRVRREGDAYRVLDIDVEGVSMALSEREQVAATIQRNGGTVASLNRTLAAKLQDGATSASR
jgi:phospholipid transport system substrate-binding protein